MKAKFSTKFREQFKVYLEPLLVFGCKHQANKTKCRTMSKYVRYAVINQLIRDGYPLKNITNKFNDFYRAIAYNK